MGRNPEAGYGKLIALKNTGKTLGQTFYVSASTGLNALVLSEIFRPDQAQVRVYSSITAALAQCVTNRNDVIIIAPDFVTAPTDVELTSAGTKKVSIVYANQTEDSEQLVSTPSTALPATTTRTIFTVTGVCELIAVVGVVTTVIQTQACNLKISTVSNSATTDICADLNVTGGVAQSRLSITGTFANALINTAKGVPVARQATPLIVQEGTIIITTSATNTGAIRWMALFKPLQPGARIYSA